MNPGSEQDLNGFRSLEYWPLGWDPVYNTMPKRDRALILENGAFRPGMYHLHGRKKGLNLFCCEETLGNWGPQELPRVSSTSTWTLTTPLAMKCAVQCFSVSSGVQKSHYTRIHSEILTPLFSSYVYKIQSTRRWQKIQSIRWQKQFAVTIPFLQTSLMKSKLNSWLLWWLLPFLILK